MVQYRTRKVRGKNKVYPLKMVAKGKYKVPYPYSSGLQPVLSLKEAKKVYGKVKVSKRKSPVKSKLLTKQTIYTVHNNKILNRWSWKHSILLRTTTEGTIINDGRIVKKRKGKWIYDLKWVS